jgi:hypothetical protein
MTTVWASGTVTPVQRRPRVRVVRADPTGKSHQVERLAAVRTSTTILGLTPVVTPGGQPAT